MCEIWGGATLHQRVQHQASISVTADVIKLSIYLL